MISKSSPPCAAPLVAHLPPLVRPLMETWNVLRVTEEGWEDDTRRLIGELSTATGLVAQPDVDTLLRDAAAAQQRLADLEYTRHLQTDQIDGLRHSVDELTRKLADARAGERRGLAEAFAALAQGDSRAAEDAFEDAFNQQSRAIDEARTLMAEAARNVANLALLRDVGKAATFYERALAVEPDDADTARSLGRAWMLLGDLGAADAAFARSLSASVTTKDSGGEIAAYLGRGDVLVAQGDGPEGLAAYQRVLAIAEALAARDPAKTQWQEYLSNSHDRIGDVLVAQGDAAGALTAYRRGLAIREALAARDPANTRWQEDLTSSLDHIGDVLLTQGDWTGAMATFRRALETTRMLTARDAANTYWQRDLAIRHTKIGDMLLEQGDAAGALATFRRALVTAEMLTAVDPANAQWQWDLSVSHNKIGHVLLAQGDRAGALAAFRRGLTTAEVLASRDPANTQWQRDLARCHANIGDVLLSQGDRVAAYRRGLAIAEALATRDPTNTQWQRDVIMHLVRLSDATGDNTLAGRALDVALNLQQRGVLAPGDEWMIEDLRQRSGR